MSKLARVLLVEDDEVDVMTVRRAFKRTEQNLPLEVRGDGVRALSALRNGEIRVEGLLILLDINMPRMNGLEFLEEIRRDPKLRAIPVVVLTSSDHERDRFEAYNQNVAGYIVKPVTFEKFVEVVSALGDYWSSVEFP